MKMHWRWLCIVFISGITLIETTPDTPPKLFQDYWQWTLKTFPETATNTGIHEDDDKVDPHSEADKLKHLKIYKEFLKRAEDLLESRQNEKDTITLKVLKRELELLKQNIELKGYLFAVNNLDSSQVRFGFTLKSQKLENEADYRKFLKRLNSLSKQIEEDIELMKRGIEEHMTYHNSSVYDVPRQISLLEVDPVQTIYYKAFRDENIPSTINSTLVKEELRSSAIQVIKESIQPAYKKLREFMENKYSRSLRPGIGLSSVPNGQELYSYMIRKFTSTSMTPEEIHEIGLKEVERISKEMQGIINKLGFNENVKQFSNRIRKDKKLMFSSKEELLNYSRNLIFNKIYPALPKAFKRGPKMNLKVESVPESMAKGQGAFYSPGSVKENRPGTIFLNAYEYASTLKLEMPTLCMHEGSPGHHFHIASFLEKKDIPNFRKNRNEVVTNMYAGIIEGWALYAEFLGIELGIFEDLYDLYGHYSDENFRACRLVVDTGIHYFNWTKERAIDYFLENTALSRTSIEREINRYITWPGQALAYKIGDLKIREMRSFAEKQLGSNFDLGDFHEVVLDCGPVSMEILTDCIDNYIKEKG